MGQRGARRHDPGRLHQHARFIELDPRIARPKKGRQPPARRGRQAVEELDLGQNKNGSAGARDQRASPRPIAKEPAGFSDVPALQGVRQGLRRLRPQRRDDGDVRARQILPILDWNGQALGCLHMFADADEADPEMRRSARGLRQIILKAKPDKADALRKFLEGGLALANSESETPVWFALRFDPQTFGIFDAFADEHGREAHLNGSIAAALMARADELLAEPPSIEKVEILAVKLPA
jgi:quinol monooxygenase YgiN